MFCESREERTAEDRQARAKQTFEEMMTYLPGELWSRLQPAVTSHCSCVTKPLVLQEVCGLLIIVKQVVLTVFIELLCGFKPATSDV